MLVGGRPEVIGAGGDQHPQRGRGGGLGVAAGLGDDAQQLAGEQRVAAALPRHPPRRPVEPLAVPGDPQRGGDAAQRRRAQLPSRGAGAGAERSSATVSAASLSGSTSVGR